MPVQKLRFVWSRESNAFNCRSASTAAVAGGEKTVMRTQIEEGDIFIRVRAADAKSENQFV